MDLQEINSDVEKIRDIIGFIAGTTPVEKIPWWPPDAFAIAAWLLERSGGYVTVISSWPPAHTPAREGWKDRIANLAKEWRERSAEGLEPPSSVLSLWHQVTTSDLPLSAIGVSDGCPVCSALVELLAAADQTCWGVGIPGGDSCKFDDIMVQLLEKKRPNGASSLCYRISSDKLSVVPKLHTPQSGITIRSLSHHLALSSQPGVVPKWQWVDHPQIGDDRHGLNMLVFPWPLEVKPTDFRPHNPRNGNLRNMNAGFGFFEYNDRSRFDAKKFEQLVRIAEMEVGPVDVVVFPELALTQRDVDTLSGSISEMEHRPIAICGACLKDPQSEMWRNTSVTLIPLSKKGVSGKTQIVRMEQDKHHRWRVDGSQIDQYGLGGVLDPEIVWWEYTRVSRRELRFVSVQPWLTFCTLICEDLARPDPIANLVRSVGPNLVVALLMDGPQLARRWPARYGTVLADDPGSSVLTVSPLGMVKLSRPRGCTPSNVVALWKDAVSGDPTEISLPDGYDALMVSLTRKWKEEFTADGRGDGGITSHLCLSGVHPIRCRPDK